MQQVFLCGQTGSINRGCEAIVRSTVKLLNRRGGDIHLVTFAPNQDNIVVRNLGINMIEYAKYPSTIYRYVCAGFRKILCMPTVGQGFIQKPLFSRLRKDDICLNIGGDTYCYGTPIVSMALNKFNYRKNITSILWCCSIEKESMKGQVLRDLKRYSYIFAREKLTYDALIESGIHQDRIVRCCDPAFFLDAEEVPLPDSFLKGNTVGINISPIVDKNPNVYSNFKSVIRYILEQTNMSICLIPHVYDVKENMGDYAILKKFYDEFDNKRISILDKDFNCEQLKYVISQCRFFIGARTHATIAAYSTGVPTLVVGYSVKSKGIATDLFETDKGYVVPYQDLTDKDELLILFQNLVKNEDKIRNRLNSILPNYKRQLTDAIQKYLSSDNNDNTLEICDRELCSGCSACANLCPVEAIKMTKDKNGFLYPEIDASKCIKCGLCAKKCPSANKYKDDNKTPRVFSCVNKDKDVQKSSSSGGVFTAIAEKILNKGGVVFGAGYCENFDVVQKECTSISSLGELRGSKYVQSDSGDTYCSVKQYLENGKTVLYTGTPCQIDGLKAFLGKDYDNLYTMDFVCHGVPSPLVWTNYLREMEKQYGSKASEVFFRDKEKGWKNFSLRIVFENGEHYSKTVSEDPYLRGFVSDLYLRSSCFRCSSKQVHRQGDITIGDFWGVYNTHIETKDDMGTSVVMIHSSKGQELFDEISNDMLSEETLFDCVIKNNPSYVRSVKQSIYRKHFFQYIKSHSNCIKAINRYSGSGVVAKIRRALLRYNF